MSGIRSLFWRKLIHVESAAVERDRLWNGYLGWKLPSHVKAAMEPPAGDWPLLDDREKEGLDALAESCGGHPEYPSDGAPYMDLSQLVFDQQIDCKGKLFVQADFSDTLFESTVDFKRSAFVGRADFREATFLTTVDFGQTHFYEEADFRQATFLAAVDFSQTHFREEVHFSAVSFFAAVDFSQTHFHEEVHFSFADFMGNANLDRVKFKRMPNFESAFFGAVTTFSGSSFREGVTFRGSIFQITDFNRTEFSGPSEFRATSFGALTSFRGCTFVDGAIFSEARFHDETDFVDAEFKASTSFREAKFSDVPKLFNTTLHEDTDFSNITWRRAEDGYLATHDPADVEDSIRALERLELIMSRLEKPYDRHEFYRLKMRARRRMPAGWRLDRRFLQVLNGLFEITCDYGWGAGRAFLWWMAHWLISAGFLFCNAMFAPLRCNANSAYREEWVELGLASLATGFANAHSILLLAARDGYLVAQRELLVKMGGVCLINGESLCIVKMVGLYEAVLGPVLLFFVLLTLRNRFRLA